MSAQLLIATQLADTLLAELQSALAVDGAFRPSVSVGNAPVGEGTTTADLLLACCGAEPDLGWLNAWGCWAQARDVPKVAVVADERALSLVEDLGIASDYLVAPFSSHEVWLRIRRALRRAAPRRDARANLDARSAAVLDSVLGVTPAIQSLKAQLCKVAQADATVVISGETGTGKEVVARAIHELSPRAVHPFVPVNCGAIPGELLENELFGHSRGAFTDARHAAQGLVGHAERGTLFLDEVDAIPLSGQVKLLQFLQSKGYRPLGGGAIRTANVRVLAATNQELLSRVRAGTFREDLYYRLNIIPITLPALRDRLGDVRLLAEHFIDRHAPEGTRQRWGLAPDLLAILQSCSWPGNVRELENLVQRLLAMHAPGVLHASDLPEHFRGQQPHPPEHAWEYRSAKRRALAVFERDYAQRLMAAFDGNITRAARAAGKDRRALGRLVKRAGIKTVPPAGNCDA